MNWAPVGNMAPQCGKTSAIAAAAKQINATLVVRDQNEVRRIQKIFKIDCVSVQESEERIRATRGPYLFDTDAVGLMAGIYETRIEALEKEFEKLKEAYRLLKISHDILNEDDNL